MIDLGHPGAGIPDGGTTRADEARRAARSVPTPSSSSSLSPRDRHRNHDRRRPAHAGVDEVGAGEGDGAAGDRDRMHLLASQCEPKRGDTAGIRYVVDAARVLPYRPAFEAIST